MRIRFGPCTLDSERRELRGALDSVQLSPRAVDIIDYIAARRPRAVSND